jgi:hypothetical protein
MPLGRGQREVGALFALEQALCIERQYSSHIELPHRDIPVLYPIMGPLQPESPFSQ